MKTNISFKQENLINAFKLHYNTKYPIRSRLMFFVGVFTLFLGLVSVYFNLFEKLEFLKYLLVLVGVFYMGMYFYRRKKLYERASSQSTFKGSFTFEINKKGITFGKDNKVSVCDWKNITSIIKDEFNVLFYFGKDRFYILPLENIDSEQSKELDEILKNKM